MSGGDSLRYICEDHLLPSEGTVLRFVFSDTEFREQYDAAMRIRSEKLAAQCVDIADDASTDTDAKQRLRVDTRKWFAARMAPKRWGDKQQVEVSGPDGAPISFTQLARKAEE
jgi:hypothetical protein